ADVADHAPCACDAVGVVLDGSKRLRDERVVRIGLLAPPDAEVRRLLKRALAKLIADQHFEHPPVVGVYDVLAQRATDHDNLREHRSWEPALEILVCGDL